MTWQLMKRDPAWQWMPWLTLASALYCVMWHFFAPADRPNTATFALFEMVFFTLTFAALTAALAQQSETPFQATLPVTVRQVFLARMVSMVALLWAPVLACIAILALMQDPVVSDLPVIWWWAFTSAALVTQCVAIRGIAIPRLLIYQLGFLWVFGYGARWLIAEDSVAGTYVVAACCVIAAAVLVRTWQRVPASFLEAPIKASSAPATINKSAGARDSSTPSWKTPLWTAVQTQGPAQILAPFVVMILGGTASAFWLPALAFQWAGIRTQFRWMFALPISPRVLLAASVLPMLAGLCGGYEVSLRLPWLPLPSMRGVSVRHAQVLFDSHLSSSQIADCKMSNVLPSLEYWIPVRSGKAPLIQSPWGETFQPSAYRESGFDVYNPYAVGCENSQRFLDWQFRRATIAIYGRPIPLDKKVDPYVEQTPIAGFRTQLVNFAVFAGMSMLSLLVGIANDWYRVRRLPRTVRIACMSLAVASAVEVFVLVAFRRLDIMQWLSWTLPVNMAAAAAMIVVSLALLYLAVGRLFRQLEFADKPARGVA